MCSTCSSAWRVVAWLLAALLPALDDFERDGLASFAAGYRHRDLLLGQTVPILTNLMKSERT